MKRGTLSLIAALTLVSLAPLGVSDAPVDEDRSFDYIGTARYDHGLMDTCDEATTDCPFFIPSRAKYAHCDHEDAVIAPPGAPPQWHGIGGGVFCDIRKQTNVTITIHDLLLEQPSGMVTCPSHGKGPGLPPNPIYPLLAPLFVSWQILIGEADPSLTFEVPEDCWDPPGTSDKVPGELTELSVFMNIGAGTTGHVTLEYND